MDSIMKHPERRFNVPKELLDKEFLSQFKTEDDVSQFLKEIHSQVLEQMLQGEMDVHLGYSKHSPEGYTVVIHAMAALTKLFVRSMAKSQ